jgi:hypothetical protein
MSTRYVPGTSNRRKLPESWGDYDLWETCFHRDNDEYTLSRIFCVEILELAEDYGARFYGTFYDEYSYEMHFSKRGYGSLGIMDITLDRFEKLHEWMPYMSDRTRHLAVIADIDARRKEYMLHIVDTIGEATLGLK